MATATDAPGHDRPRGSQSGGSTLLEVSHLTKVFGKGRAPAVNDVSFSVKVGEFFVVMGLSGSGKSTLLRMINRLIEPTQGEISFEGTDIAKMSAPDLRKVRNERMNMVFQHFALLPHKTIRDNAAYGLDIRGMSKSERYERADEALETVGLGSWGDSKPDELSGGMRQRVGLARALATDADVMLMDEPFSALDPLIRREMQDLLLELQANRRRTVLFVTHDLNEAMRLGDRIMIMRDGKVVQMDTGPNILANPADAYVADFISDVDRSRVLTAGAVMDRGDQGGRDSNVTVHTPLADVCRLFGQAPGALNVAADDGSVAGTLNEQAVLRALADPRSEQHA